MKKNNGGAYETKIGDEEHQFDYNFEFDTNTKSRFVRIPFNRLHRLPVAYTTTYPSKKNKYFDITFFH